MLSTRPVICVAVFAAFVYHISPILPLLNPFVPMELTPASCKLIGAEWARNSEDCARLDNKRLLVSVGDLGSILFYGNYSPDGDPARGAAPGAIGLLDMEAQSLTKLKLRGLKCS